MLVNKKHKRNEIIPLFQKKKKCTLIIFFKVGKNMHRPGIEPGAQRWQRWILPLNHRCLVSFDVKGLLWELFTRRRVTCDLGGLLLGL